MRNTTVKFLFIILASVQCAHAASIYYDDERGTFLAGELLYWTATQKGLDFATIEGTFPDNPPGVSDEGFTRYSLDHGWTPGFRLHAGYRGGTNQWVVRSAYTYWSNTTKDSVEVITQAAIGTQEQQSIIYSGKASLDYRTADIVFENPCDFTCWSELRPFVGFRALWIDQRFESQSEQIPSNTVTDDVTEKSALFAKGMYAGLDYRWDVTSGFSFWQSSSASLLDGEIQSTHTSDTLEQVVRSDKHCGPIAGLSLGTGIGWESCYCLCNTLMRFRLDLGYEFNQWFSVTEGTHDLFESGDARGIINDSIMLHGGTLKLSLFF